MILSYFLLTLHFVTDFTLTGTLSTKLSSSGNASKLIGKNEVMLLGTDGAVISSDGSSGSIATCWK